MNYRRKIITSLLHQHNKWNKTVASLNIQQIDPEVIEIGNRSEYDEFMREAKQLQSEGFLIIKERNFDYPKLILTEDLEIIVSYARKENIYTIDEYVYDCLTILNEFANNNCIQIKTYCTEQINNLNNHKKVSICPYNEHINTSNTLREILTGALAVFLQSEDILIRNFSISIYGDSKKFASHMNKICKILAPTEIDEVDCYNILNEFHIFQNPSTVTFKGDFTINFDNDDILHSRKDASISLGPSFIPTIKNIVCKNIISIENLTSFNSYIPQENELVIYLGGFANSLTIDFIKKALTPNMTHYHFGDIDAGGFNILLNLESRISHPIIPYKMSISELQQYSELTKQLTINDINKLKSIKNRDVRFNETIDYMIKTNCKLEQESLDSFVFDY